MVRTGLQASSPVSGCCVIDRLEQALRDTNGYKRPERIFLTALEVASILGFAAGDVILTVKQFWERGLDVPESGTRRWVNRGGSGISARRYRCRARQGLNGFRRRIP